MDDTSRKNYIISVDWIQKNMMMPITSPNSNNYFINVDTDPKKTEEVIYIKRHKII